MPDQPTIVIVISTVDLAKDLVLLKAFGDALPPELINLTMGQRKSVIKMADKSVAFCEKALEFATINPELCPNYVDLVAMKQDIDAYSTLNTICRNAVVITSKLDDSSMQVGSQAYEAALSIYTTVKDAARRNKSGAKEAEIELKKRFPGRKTKTPVPPTN